MDGNGPVLGGIQLGVSGFGVRQVIGFDAGQGQPGADFTRRVVRFLGHPHSRTKRLDGE